MLILWFIGFWVFAPLVLVAVGLPFKRYKGDRLLNNGKTIKQYELPDWLGWLHNLEDGLTGDWRGWYWFEYFPDWVPGWFKMLWWSGVRNPWNKLKRFVIGIDVRQYNIVKLCGVDYVRDDLDSQGFQILIAHPLDGGLPRPMLYWVKDLHKGRGICFQFGWKIKLEHNDIKYVDEYDYWKGFTFEPNIYKDLT